MSDIHQDFIAMGACCSKEFTGQVSPSIPEAESSNVVSDNVVANKKLKIEEREQTDLLSAPSLVLGRHERTLKARQFLPYDAHTMRKPKATTGQPWTDTTFPHVFQEDRDGEPIKLTWKRPMDLTSNVRLFGDAINGYCVKKGEGSDCFFMSTLSALADHPEYIKQIFPEDAYETEPGKYTGIVHCRFWWMGEWLDVYTDDVLPCYDDSDEYVAGHSYEKDIVWVPLVEKALARLYGSYPKIAGDPSDFFRLLTGGLVEEFKTIQRRKNDNFLPPEKLFERIDSALKSGSIVLTGISKITDELLHGYSVTETLKVERPLKVTRLVKIRNLWGEKQKTNRRVNDGEREGRRSHISTESKEVSDALRKERDLYLDIGEFWIDMVDFFHRFKYIYVCDRIPNFDEDGFRKDDGLNKVINILGEWHGETAAGDDDENKMRNPRFILTIPGQNNVKAVPVVIEITRQQENPANSADDNDDLYGVIDLFRVEKEEVRNNRLWISLNEQAAAEKSHIGCRTSTYLCKLATGDYLLLPYYYDSRAKPPISKSFCIRIFTNVNISCSQMNEYPVALYGKPDPTFDSLQPDNKQTAACVLNIFGEWKDETAGGCEANKMKNPKFLLTIPDIKGSGQQETLVLQLRCSRDAEEMLLPQLDVFKIIGDETIEERSWISMNQITNKATHRLTGDYSCKYELKPGKYLLLPFIDDDEPITGAFCIRILASSEVECSQMNVYPVALYGKPDPTFDSLQPDKKKTDKVINILGEWHGKTAAGDEDNKKMRNPRFILTIPGQNNVNAVPVVIELTWYHENPANSTDDNDALYGMIDLLMVEKEEVRNNRLWMSLNEQAAAEKSHNGCLTSTYLYKLSTGDYLLVPYYYHIRRKPPFSKSFCIRIFTNVNTNCRKMNEYPVALYGKPDPTFNSLQPDNKQTAACVLNIFGEWKGETAAGSSENKMKNPKFLLTIPDIKGSEQQVTLVLQLRRNRDLDEDLLPDLDFFKVEKDEIIEGRRWMSMNEICNRTTVRYSGDNSLKYEVMPGNYLLLPFFYNCDPITCEFCIRILASSQVKCSQMNEYPVALYGNPDPPLYSMKSDNKQTAACVLNIFGEWKDETSVDHWLMENRMKNSKFLLDIPDIKGSEKPVTLTLQLRCRRDLETLPKAGLDVFEIEKDQLIENRRWMSIKKITKTTNFYHSYDSFFQYELMPGNYLILPFLSYFLDEEPLTCAFCIRLSASSQVKCRPLTEKSCLFVREAENILEFKNQSFTLKKIDIKFGEWVKNVTAGGQFSHDSFANNPQYGLSIPGRDRQPVLIDLLQETVKPMPAIGCHIIRIDKGQSFPVDRDVLRHNESIDTVEENIHNFLPNSEVHDYYMLPPGRYVILVYADKPTDEKKFALVIAAQAQSNVSLTEPK